MKTGSALALAVAACLVTAPALAKKPEGVGQGHGNANQESHGNSDHGNSGQGSGGHGNAPGFAGDHGNSGKAKVHFADKDRGLIRDYFGREFKRGNCPPGLAKKHNGCMPPGLAKQWSLGRRLGDDVRFYDLPRELLRKLGVIPKGHKYVRVGNDVLLMDVGSRIIVDAISDL